MALCRNGEILFTHDEAMARGQDSRLLPMVEKALAETGLNFSALDRIAALRGPGSFTGIRVGLAAAQGLGLALDRPVIGLERFALYRIVNKPCLIVLESRREELFTFTFDAPAVPAMITRAEILAFAAQHPNIMISGDAAIDGLSIQPLPETEAAGAARCAENIVDIQDYPPLPLYGREPDVSQPKNLIRP